MKPMATTSALMTVEQFSAMPEGQAGRYELHHGVPVFMPPPKHLHFAVCHRLAEVLRPRSTHGIIGTEVPFRPLPEYECWVADVAYMSQARFEETAPNDWLHGAPELVIEVLSPSNTADEMNDREAICLENGCLGFWVVNPKRKTVKVSTPDRHTITYIEGEKIPLTIPGAGELAVSEIFS